MEATKVLDTEIAALSSEFPGLPLEYFEYLRTVGWGETAKGRMIYSGPVAPQDILGDDFHRTDIVLLGDDLAGYCFGYDFTASTYGELSPNGNWQPWPPGKGFGLYVGT